MSGHEANRDKSRYSEYHREYVHDTDECRILKIEMEKLIKRGHLKELVDTITSSPKKPTKRKPKLPMRSRREVYCSSSASISMEAISFSDDELQGLDLPHDDSVIIALFIALVDIGSTSDILYLSTYDKLGLPRNMLQTMHTPLTDYRIEVEMLLKGDAIHELQFPKWIANVVLVKKSNGTWRMYTDFTSLNKACPKDFYPLPCLARLVDGSTGHEVFDFIYASLDYHQMKLYPEDEKNTAFIT
ncbi:hypothetical protein LIER_06798 [Lithospermum erythrorhizon]|uniref:Transposon Ty3-I Gag-Pol polyprotein n=1 Tax=Lithospermum erythrorhizon TaxID=34254 RepID=A0AAV3P5N8_LITER